MNEHKLTRSLRRLASFGTAALLLAGTIGTGTPVHAATASPTASPTPATKPAPPKGTPATAPAALPANAPKPGVLPTVPPSLHGGRL